MLTTGNVFNVYAGNFFKLSSTNVERGSRMELGLELSRLELLVLEINLDCTRRS